MCVCVDESVGVCVFRCVGMCVCIYVCVGVWVCVGVYGNAQWHMGDADSGAKESDDQHHHVSYYCSRRSGSGQSYIVTSLRKDLTVALYFT